MANSALGPTTIEKQILLLKLTELMENRPDFGEKRNPNPDSPPRIWISKAHGIVQRLDVGAKVKFDSFVQLSSKHWSWSIGEIQSHLHDIIEGLKIDLEIDGRSEIGSTYGPGEVYKFFSDLKKVIKGSETEIFVIDPYFNGEAFDDYLSDVPSGLKIRIFLKKAPADVVPYVKRHIAQFATDIELRSSKKLHDRIIFIDNDECWIMGGSIKDGGRAPTYLIPLVPSISQQKLATYDDLWTHAKQQSIA